MPHKHTHKRTCMHTKHYDTKIMEHTNIQKQVAVAPTVAHVVVVAMVASLGELVSYARLEDHAAQACGQLGWVRLEEEGEGHALVLWL